MNSKQLKLLTLRTSLTGNLAAIAKAFRSDSIPNAVTAADEAQWDTYFETQKQIKQIDGFLVDTASSADEIGRLHAALSQKKKDTKVLLDEIAQLKAANAELSRELSQAMVSPKEAA